MNHKEFVEKYKKGELEVMVHRTNSLRAISAGYLPKRYFWAHTFWSWIWFISIPAGIIFLFIKTWLGILILFFISFLGGQAVRKSAQEFVLEHTLEDENFYKFAVEGGLIIIKELTPINVVKRKSN